MSKRDLDAEDRKHLRIPEPIRCAFCRKKIDSDAWCISFGNSSLLGNEVVDQVCGDCILDGFEELSQYREEAKHHGYEIHPFDCNSCPACRGTKDVGRLT